MNWPKLDKTYKNKLVQNEIVLNEFKNKKIYGRVSPECIETTSNGYVYVQVSLRTEDMIIKDYEYFVKSRDNEKKDDKYLPYFFEFIGTVKWKDYEKNRKQLEDNWFLIKLYDETDKACPKGEKRKQANSNGIVMRGTVIFSASPIVRRRNYLYIDFGKKICENEQINALEKIIKSKFDEWDNKNYILGKMEGYIEGRGPSKINVYNVGQGTFIEMNFSTGRTILFDVGMTVQDKIENNNYILDNVALFMHLKPDVIILSHWDIDHILGIAYMEDCVNENGKDIIWVVPNMLKILNSVSQSARLLLLYLLINKRKVYIANQTMGASNNKERLIFPLRDDKEKNRDAKFQIWQGDGKKGTFNKNNNVGLIIQIGAKGEDKILLPGDCEYSHMPCDCRCNYKYMVVSHHGAKQEIPEELRSSDYDSSICICSVGKNSYGHPNLKTRGRLRELGYHIENTEEVRKYVISSSGREYSFATITSNGDD